MKVRFLSFRRRRERKRPEDRFAQLRQATIVLEDKACQQSLAGPRQAQAHQPPVFRVSFPPNEPGPNATVDQAHRALVPGLKALGEVSHRRPVTGKPLDEQQDLILRRRDARLPTGVLRKAKEAAERVAKFREPLVVILVESFAFRRGAILSTGSRRAPCPMTLRVPRPKLYRCTI
jgi:hypothetical protein